MCAVSSALVGKLSEVKPAASLEASSGEDPGQEAYVAWHIRTVDPAELAGPYNASVHKYMITEPPSVVCPIFEQESVRVQTTCPAVFSGLLEVFVSANRFEPVPK